MKFLLITIITALLSSCGNTTRSTNHIEDVSKKYIQDSILPTFNDPKSYELAELKLDSINSHTVAQSEIDKLNEKITEDSLKLERNKSEMRSDKLESTGSKLDKSIEESGRSIDSSIKGLLSFLNIEKERYKKILSGPDTLDHVLVHAKYRGKNKMGALVLNRMTLKYNSHTDKVNFLNED